MIEEEDGRRLTQQQRELLIDLPADVAAPAAARHAISELVGADRLAAARRDTVVLLVSEVVTNAVIHPEVPDDAQIGLSAVVTPELTRIVVSDQGAGFERPDTGLPQGRPGGGYGLYVLNAAASRWDTMKAPGRFSVWFELDHAA